MRKGILITGGIFLALGIVYLIQALQYGIGPSGRPGPGLYPIFAVAVLLTGAIGMIVNAWLRPTAAAIAWPVGKERWRVLAIIAVSLFYAFTLEFIGYFLGSAVVMLTCLHVMGMRSWLLKIGLTLAVTILSFLIFDKVLSVPLPTGFIGFF
jgi:putative tricarboxylic transport membrane protein